MKVTYHRHFRKAVGKLPTSVKSKLADRIEIFASNPLDKRLRSHALNSPYKDSYSIGITGDYRAIYIWLDAGSVLLLT